MGIHGYPTKIFRDVLAEFSANSWSSLPSARGAPHGEQTRRQVFSLKELAEIEVGLGRRALQIQKHGFKVGCVCCF